jgi:hypothetical protein
MSDDAVLPGIEEHRREFGRVGNVGLLMDWLGAHHTLRFLRSSTRRMDKSSSWSPVLGPVPASRSPQVVSVEATMFAKLGLLPFQQEDESDLPMDKRRRIGFVGCPVMGRTALYSETTGRVSLRRLGRTVTTD